MSNCNCNIPLKTHTVVLTVAPSAAGKTTFIQNKIKELESQYPRFRFRHLSSDWNRLFLNYNLDRIDTTCWEDKKGKFETVSKAAFDLLYSQLDQLTSYPVNSEVVFVDATHLSTKLRQPIIDIAQKNNYNIVGLIFKYNNKKDYFENLGNQDKRIVENHVDKFYKETIRTIGDLKSKFYVKDKENLFANYGIEITDYESYLDHLLDHNKYFLIGDVHGCYELLEEAVNYAKSQNLTPLLIGDICDKNSKENIFKTIELVHHEVVENGSSLLLDSNHDHAVYSWLANEGKYTKDVIEQLFETALYLEDAPIIRDKFLNTMELAKPFYLNKDLEFVATHAPCEPKYLAKLDNHSRKAQRNWRYPKLQDYDSHDDWSKAICNNIYKLEADEYNFPLHVSGHVMLDQAIKSLSFASIDTGAVAGHYLTGLDVSRRKGNIKKFGNGNISDDLVKVIRKEQQIDLYSLEPKERGRVYWAATHGLPVTSGTMCPADKDENELESLDWALDYFDKPVIQPKFMGSWSVVRLKQDPKECKTFSRNGYLVRKEGEQLKELEEAYKTLINRLSWENVDEYIIGAELMPWRFLGETLIDKEFFGLGYLVDRQLDYLKDNGFQKALGQLNDFIEHNNIKGSKEEVIQQHGHHIWSTKDVSHKLSGEQYSDLALLKKENNAFLHEVERFGQQYPTRFEPFVIYKVIYKNGKEEIKAEENVDNWRLLNDRPIHVVNKEDDCWRRNARYFFDQITNLDGEEGVVVKPQVKEKGKAPYLKVRNTEYLRLAYGYDYKLHLNYHRRKKNIKRKLDQSIKDWDRAMKYLEIPVAEINDKNKKALNLIADFVVGEKKQENIDPRL